MTRRKGTSGAMLREGFYHPSDINVQARACDRCAPTAQNSLSKRLLCWGAAQSLTALACDMYSLAVACKCLRHL